MKSIGLRGKTQFFPSRDNMISALAYDGDAILLTGGGARSRVWTQMIADVAGREVRVPEGTQFGARGAALLVATALGHFPDIRAASAAVAGASVAFRPDVARASAYADALRRYRDHRDRLLAARPRPF